MTIATIAEAPSVYDVRIVPRLPLSLSLCLLTFACGSREPAAKPTAPAAPQTASVATQTPAAEFDREAAVRVINSVALDACFEKPPFLDAQLHVSLTLQPTGRVEASADRPYAGTEAGECAVALFRNVHVPPWIGVPKEMGRTIPHATARNDAGAQ